MTIFTSYLVYPDGDTQETENRLTVNQFVDMNGFPVSLPIASHKMIIYRVFKIRRADERGEETTYYHLELVTGIELVSLAK
jgi:hypothetical protein